MKLLQRRFERGTVLQNYPNKLPIIVTLKIRKRITKSRYSYFLSKVGVSSHHIFFLAAPELNMYLSKAYIGKVLFTRLWEI